MSLARCLDLLYPPACALCEEPLREGRSLCEPCQAALPRIESPFCIRCGAAIDGALPDDLLCPGCRVRPFSFEFARAALKARHEALALVRSFKYGRRIHLHRELALLLAEVWNDPRLAAQQDPPWSLVPVPLHWKRQRQRWFNQSFELARTLSRLRNLPLVPALRRIRVTPQQALLPRSERLRNLQGAFRLSRREAHSRSLRGKPVALIDDVFTTGSTSEECARILLEQGEVEKVIVLTVLRG